METPSSHPTRSRSTRINKRLKRKQLAQKQNGFVLDCLNQQKSSLKLYNSISDKFLNYFVIRVHPNTNKTHKKVNSIAKVSKLEQIESQNHNRFQDMLKSEKEKYTPLARRMHHKMATNPRTIQQVAESRQKGLETEKIKIEDFDSSIKYKEKRESAKEIQKKQYEAVAAEPQ